MLSLVSQEATPFSSSAYLTGNASDTSVSFIRYVCSSPHERLSSSSCDAAMLAWTSLFVLRNVAMQYSYVHIVTVAAGTARIMLVPMPA